MRILLFRNKDWGESWKKFFKPRKSHLAHCCQASWRSIRLKRNQVFIDITPGLAFSATGTHATTTALPFGLWKKDFESKGLSVLDVGTGSGVLAIIAAKLGASKFWGLIRTIF